MILKSSLSPKCASSLYSLLLRTSTQAYRSSKVWIPEGGWLAFGCRDSLDWSYDFDERNFMQRVWLNDRLRCQWWEVRGLYQGRTGGPATKVMILRIYKTTVTRFWQGMLWASQFIYSWCPERGLTSERLLVPNKSLVPSLVFIV